MKRRRGRGQGSIRQRDNGTWEVRYTIGVKADGTPNRKSAYFSTRAEAREFLQRTAAEIGLGGHRENSRITLRDWASECLDVYAPALSPETVRGYRSSIKCHLTDTDIAGIGLSDIRPAHIQRWINSQTDLSPKSVRNNNAVLSWLMSCAVRDGLIEESPVRGIVLPAKKPPERRVMSEEHCKKILAYASQHRDGMLWTILAVTGMRLSEALGLSWSAVDIRTGRYRIVQTVVYDNGKCIIRDGTKTPSSIRAGILPGNVLPMLATHKAEQDARRAEMGDLWQDNDLVFPDDFGNPARRTTLESRLRDLQRKVIGIPQEEVVGFHAFRHLLATKLLRSGAPDKAVAAHLGHTNVNYTRYQYADVYTEDMNDIASIAAGLLR